MEANEIEDDNADVGSVTYFVDDEGNCYYQPTMKTPLIQSITPLSNAGNTEDMGQNDAQMLVEDEMFQTGILVPTKTVTSEILYFLIAQEDPQPDSNGNVDVQVDQQDKGNDECTLNDKKEDTGFTIELEMNSHSESITENSHKIVKNSDKLNISKLTCKLCNYTTHKTDLLLHHMKSHPDEKPYKCYICQQCFKTLCSLHNHLNMHNDIKSKICKHCHSTFTTSGELAKHVRYNHTSKKLHKCKECDYASVELSNLQRHVRCHTGERPYPCPQCTYASADTYTLARHLRTHTGEKPYKCDDCNMCFAQSNTLKSHKLIHNKSEKKAFSCELCPATYGRKIHLRNHVKNLHTIENLKCKDCSNIFSDRYTWNIHNKTHESEKCFKCSMCPYAFTTSDNLRLHMVKHIGEKSFSCHECDQIFLQKQLLRRHQKIIHKPQKIHPCHECKRNYANKSNLMRHLAVVHNQKFSQEKRPQNFKLGGQKLIERDQIEDTAKLDSNKEDSEDDKGELKLDEEWDELKLEDLVAGGETDYQLDYVVLVVDDLRLMDDKEQQIAPEYGKEEKQDEQSYEIHDEKTYQQQPEVLNRMSPHM